MREIDKGLHKSRGEDEAHDISPHRKRNRSRLGGPEGIRNVRASHSGRPFILCVGSRGADETVVFSEPKPQIATRAMGWLRLPKMNLCYSYHNEKGVIGDRSVEK